MSRRYETVYIFDGSLEEAQVTDKLTRFHALLTKDGKGTMGNVSHWGKRTLAFRIKKKETGYYVVAQYETDGALLAEYERAVKLDEGVLRYLVVIASAEPARPAAATAGIGADDIEAEEEDA
jgi:small subunit ribosomal protein S6